MIIGIGSDIIHLPRLIALFNRRGEEKLARRILSPREYNHWIHRVLVHEKTRYVGVRSKLFRPVIQTDISKLFRWAIKEAAYKALQPMHRPTWKHLTLEATSPSNSKRTSKPLLSLESSSLQDVTLHSTISHDGDYILAFVVAEQQDI